MHDIGIDCKHQRPFMSRCAEFDSLAQQGIPMHSIGTECELHLADSSQPPKTLVEQVSYLQTLAASCSWALPSTIVVIASCTFQMAPSHQRPWISR